MKKPFFVLTALLFFASFAHSQAYMTAAGLRAGTDWGLTVQQRLAKSITFEGIVQSSLQREEVMITALAEKHYPLVFRGLNLYAGAGLHKGFLGNNPSTELVPTNHTDPFGITFVGGAEITLGKFNFSYDFKPALNVTGGTKKFYSQTGVSVRYVFLTNKQYKKMQKKKKKEKKERTRRWHPVRGWVEDMEERVRYEL